MNYIDFEVGEKSYKLILTTRATCDLEKKLGSNPLDILIAAAANQMPRISDLVLILHAAMQKYNHGVTLDNCYDIFDEYLDSGKTYADFIQFTLKLFEESGLVAKGTVEESEKN